MLLVLISILYFLRHLDSCLTDCGENYQNYENECVPVECSLRLPHANKSCSLIEDFSSLPYYECFYLKNYNSATEFTESCYSQCSKDNFEPVSNTLFRFYSLFVFILILL
jgi:hypothetical protein